jgi:hypothetical protein
VSRLATELLRGSDTRAELRTAIADLTGLLDRLERLDVSR